MNIAEIAIRRPVFAWMLMSALIIFGGISFMRMGVSQLPDVDFPVISVSATLEGAAPAVMEMDVVDPIESALMTIQGVRTVSSNAHHGRASISVEFDLDRDIDVAMQEVQNKLAQYQKQFPEGMDPPTVSKTNPEDQPILWLTVESTTMQPNQLMLYVRDYLKDKFTTVNGVGDVFLGGYLDPNLRVWVSQNALNKYSLTVSDILNTIHKEHTEYPAGLIETKEKEYNVRLLGEAHTPKEFEDLLISSRGGQPNYAPLPLKSVARIEEGLADIRRISRSMGNASVGIGIRKQRQSNAVEVSHAVKARMKEVSETLPAGTKMAVTFDSVTFIEEAIGELNFTLLLSAILTSLVCWLFLGSWSSTINVLLAIPTSVLGTFIFLYFSKFTLNTFTLLALSLAIGIVVDDAIMVLENIIRHREKGLSKQEAARVGAKEITFAALAATLAVIAIFFPVAFMQGAIGKFFFQFGVTISVAVALSLVESLTLTPMRCSQFIESGHRQTKIGQAIDVGIHQVQIFYERILSKALNHSWKVIGIAVLLFFSSIGITKLMNKEFMPPQDQSRFLVRLETPIGSSIDFTDKKFKIAEEYISSRPEMLRYFSAVGGFGGGDVNSGMIFITMKPVGQRGIDPKLKRELTQMEFMSEVRKKFNSIPDVKAVVQDLSMRGFTASRGFPVEFTIRGPEWDKLALYSNEMTKKLADTGLVVDVDSNYREGMPEIQIIPDRKQASLRGVSIESIGETIQALVGGVIAGKYPKGGHYYDIRVRLEPQDRNSPDQIKNIFVRNNRGELVRLSELVKIIQQPTLQTISRQGRERAVTVFANIAPGKSQQKALEAAEQVAKEILPPGYRIAFSGSSATYKDSSTSLIFALLLGILISYMILASQFNSFKDPIVVLVALPFSITGALIALWIAQQSINIYSLIGLILLMGIVKKNSIILVDFTNQLFEKNRNRSIQEVLLEACPMRLRPILMTSIATIAGAVPPALAMGPGAETRIPMAIAVIGGVLVSTVLTLVVVPCVYLVFSRSKACSSPRSYISDTMSQPPMNLP